MSHFSRYGNPKIDAEITTNVNTLWGFRHGNKCLPFR